MVEYTPLSKDTSLICVRCQKNKATHLEKDEKIDHQVDAVCEDCKGRALMDIGVSVEWVNDIGITYRDRNICLGTAKMNLDKRNHKWGEAEIIGVIITIKNVEDSQIEFGVDFRVFKPMKVMTDGEVKVEKDSEAEGKSRDEETPNGSAETRGHH